MKKDQLFVIVHLINDPLDSIKFAKGGATNHQIPSLHIDNFSDSEVIAMILKSAEENTQTFLFKVHENAEFSRLTQIFGHIARKKFKVYVQGTSTKLEGVLNKFRISFTRINTPEDILF